MAYGDGFIKVGYTFPVDVVKAIDRHNKRTGEKRSQYLARLVRQDAGGDDFIREMYTALQRACLDCNQRISDVCCSCSIGMILEKMKRS